MLRPILQMGRERMPVLKDTQTAIEAGYPDFETLAWWGVFAPKDTPSDIIASMAKSVKEILSEPAVATQLQETQQMTLLLADGKEFSTFFAKQVSIWGQVVRENNIKAYGDGTPARSPRHRPAWNRLPSRCGPIGRVGGLAMPRPLCYEAAKYPPTQRVRGPVAQPDRATVS